MTDRDFRLKVLASLGATSSIAEELLAYNKNLFDHSCLKEPIELPLKEECFVPVWKRYAGEAGAEGVFECLKGHLAQMRFPVRQGISETDFYKSATRRGVPAEKIPEATGLILKRPQELKLIMNLTPAGRIPVLITGPRDDFITLIRALTMRNEPGPVPDAMGATIVSGYNNWDRIQTLRRKWEKENQEIIAVTGLAEEFRRIVAKKELYQDRFIILSAGPYSAVSAGQIGLSEEEWKRASLTIRLEHECAHYFTRRIFSSMRNNLIDELIADYMGIVKAAGRFRADWFLLFVGLESFPDYREGGRLQNYRGKPPLSDGAFRILGAMVKNAAANLERFDNKNRDRLRGRGGMVRMLIALTYLTLEELASREASSRLEEALNNLKGRVSYKEDKDV